jgi:glutathione synthase/RimK-type ligase-like ATP-grasp enzyme
MYRRLGPENCSFFPKTYIFPRDSLLFKKDFKTQIGGPFIIKPVAASKGIGLSRYQISFIPTLSSSFFLFLLFFF